MPIGSQGYGTYVWDSEKNDWVRKTPQSKEDGFVRRSNKISYGSSGRDIINAKIKADEEKKRADEEEEIAKLNRKTALKQAQQAWEEANRREYELVNSGKAPSVYSGVGKRPS